MGEKKKGTGFTEVSYLPGLMQPRAPTDGVTVERVGLTVPANDLPPLDASTLK